jgi:hypothetical protein
MIVRVLRGDDPRNSPVVPVQMVVVLLYHLHFFPIPNRHERVVDAQLGVLAHQ